ncbi:hypothetical protein GAP32_148 [Cronobacter phage vB_CsaM_GAP32]|uniref:Uncharacterized protein n=1 Tax=Cronobacter phage vB_CsaM_GAP32 TaxID=1141136 RepID=K4F6M6_9CAUD|nr:hypothetical protein GAP32_148 [Cronobacter phage vB_CsaM_GAP32]AFC21598.1 hypothetical protein GAP32_148 [Cronobacter phage vB_CsaM_GAP32]
MLFKKKKAKRHDDESFLIAHILRGSGSVSSLLRYIKTHPESADAARSDIIKIKYWYSKCSPVVQNIVHKMVTKFELFDVENEDWRGLYTDELTQYFKVTDKETRLHFKVNSGKEAIEIKGNQTLSTNNIDWIIFLYATRSVIYIKNNIEEMIKSQANERTKNNYIELYK